MFALLAFACFLLATFDVELGKINLIALGLTFLALALLTGVWPFGRLLNRS